MHTLDILFSSNQKIHKSFCGLFFGSGTLIDRLYQLKGLKPKNKGDTNFYECCDLTKKVYLKYMHGKDINYVTYGYIFTHSALMVL